MVDVVPELAAEMERLEKLLPFFCSSPSQFLYWAGSRAAMISTRRPRGAASGRSDPPRMDRGQRPVQHRDAVAGVAGMNIDEQALRNDQTCLNQMASSQLEEVPEVFLTVAHGSLAGVIQNAPRELDLLLGAG